MNPDLKSFLAARAAAVERLLAREHPDPAALLGWHAHGAQHVFLAWLPGATRASIGAHSLTRIGAGPLHGWAGRDAPEPRAELRWRDAAGRAHAGPDPWSLPLAGPGDDAAPGGRHQRFGARVTAVLGTPGVRFTVWAPRAEALAVVLEGGCTLPMRRWPRGGGWELFVPGLGAGCRYAYEVASGSGHVLKTDPCARRVAPRPAAWGIVCGADTFAWSDDAWRARRAQAAGREPHSIYELHAASFATRDGAPLGWTELAERVVAEVLPLGFTDVELLPVLAHPHADSWGYQVTGYFAPDPRLGTPDDLRAFVDRLHAAGLGVILDWVPAHFATDVDALACFDGAPLFEPADPRRARHDAWGTLAFDFERPEVCDFLLSSARYWIESFHFDGLRVDALAAMVYRDFQRPPGEWLPAEDGSVEDAAAVAFLATLTRTLHAACPGVRLYAEDSSIRPGTTAPVDGGGLGFDARWNLGWMHDTLAYFGLDPLFRRHHHDMLLRAGDSANAEPCVLPLSHDEVVHCKRSLLGRMPGDAWQRHANLRLLYAWQWTLPGTKLLFMGGERADPDEWDHRRALPAVDPAEPLARGVATLLADLNALYRRLPALHAGDLTPGSLRWLDRDSSLHSRYAYERHGVGSVAVVALNCTPVARHGVRLGLPSGGLWRECLNTDGTAYGGSNVGNLGQVAAERDPAMGRPWSALVTLPPLAALILAPE